ncbi:MAG: glycosyl hydrolase-related protein [Kiritimatiellaeota bacterium]|nr:glycosyl hydrolase-related protein [Kiritimatiellota bacterium]
MSHFQPNIHHDRVYEVLRRIGKEIMVESRPFKAEVAVTPEPTPFAQRKKLTYKPIKEGDTWGKKWDCGWFRVTGKIPAEWKGAYVVAWLELSGEILVFGDDGEPIVGLTNGSVFDGDYQKPVFHITKSCKGGEDLAFWLDAGANGLFGMNRPGDRAGLEPGADIHGTWPAVVNRLRLCRFDHDKWQLWLDLMILANLCRILPETSARRCEVLRVCGKALDVLPLANGVKKCRAALRPLFELPTDPATVDVTAVGHSHIDTAWLWPLRETIRKCGRTFASQIGLIERYPGYVFGASQAQLYDFTKKHYPGLYEKIKKAVKKGAWEVQGAMWVEADCNLPSGESLVRQCLLGKNFFRDEFGVEVNNLWLPDVFGYSGNLPQILKKSGVDYFLTQKLSWNRYNKFPHNTFLWKGIDGSKILSHFPPEDDYNSRVIPEGLRKNEFNNAERGLVKEAICLYGIGDGGGGPKEEHVERGLRLHNLNGSPRFHFGAAQKTLEKMAAYSADLDTWEGELYFELHRATLTTQADAKRWNRRAEEALRAAEMLCASAGLDSYPAAEFDTLWKHVLTGQFHDVIPGSSIHRVYEENTATLKNVVATCKQLQAAAAKKLLKADKNAITLFNPSSTIFAGVINLPEGWEGAAIAAGELNAQAECGGNAVWVEVPAQGFLTLKKTGTKAAGTKTSQKLVLENDEVRYTFDKNLRVVEGFDKQAGFAFITKDNPANILSLYDDHPQNWDAWDIDEYYSKMCLENPKVLEFTHCASPVRSAIFAKLAIGGSTIGQIISLNHTGKRLDFITDVDWKEHHKFLRVAFPTAIEASEAKFEIQYGNVNRATHDNTKWQYAQFEAVGHRFADLSRADYGVALLNDSKYGYRVKGRELSLSLLRSSTEPDPIADLGQHHFTYSLLPHCGAFAGSPVLAAAAILNQGVEMFEGFAAPVDAALPVALEGRGVELAVLKKAEGENAYIVRLVETLGADTTATLVCADAKATLAETDLTERPALGKPFTGKAALAFTPFEIKTIKVVC